MEKDELLKIVERLWRQERNDKDLLDKMEDDSICKICMDAPVSFYFYSIVVALNRIQIQAQAQVVFMTKL